MHVSLCSELLVHGFRAQSEALGARVRLYLAIRKLIIDGRLEAGANLPPSRQLAADLELGRSTVVRVFNQLLAEGYLEGRAGSGTFVSESLAPVNGRAVQHEPGRARYALSRRGTAVADSPTSSQIQGGAFVPGVPDVGLFPFSTWRRLISRNIRYEQRHLARYGHGGYGPLKVALAEYLRVTRMMSCLPGQIVILNGSHQAIDLCARMLCDPSDRVWMEDPGYWGAVNVLRANGLEVTSVAVDEQGLSPPDDVGDEAPRLIFVSPSSQYPTGVVMSLARRLSLLEIADRHQAWIIEDDYDNEIRSRPHALGSLFGMSRTQRVIYLGTLSKVMFPGLRLAYLVVPPDLAEAFAIGNAELYREGRLIDQAALAEFIEGGHLGAHVRRMRGIYQERRECLREAIESRLDGLIEPIAGDAGLNISYRFDQQCDDVALAASALKAGIIFRPLSMYFLDPAKRRAGMNLGFAAVPIERIGAAAATLSAVLLRKKSRRR